MRHHRRHTGAHIEPGTTHHGTPGRTLAEGERCPLLTEQDLEGLAAALLGHYPRWQGDSSVWTGPRVAEIAGTARAARKHWAETKLAGTLHHPDRYIEMSGRYDGAV